MCLSSAPAIAARFRLRIRCHNCGVPSSQDLDVPDVDDAPRDMEELLQSQFLANVKFKCGRCENPIGTVIGVRELRNEMH